MALTGKQKAAMLLMSLDAATAVELVRGIDDQVLRELVVELTYLDAADFKISDNSNKVVRQFHHSLRAKETFQLNGFLDEVLKSTVGQEKAARIQSRIQQVICNPDPFWTEQSLRKIAVIVRDLSKDIRDGLLNTIFGEEHRAIEIMEELMVIWADIPDVTDRSLQNVLKGIDVNELALALYEADDAIIDKIKSNLSEQNITALYKQVLLISVPGDRDIEDARGRIIQILRDVNNKGELVFMDDECDI